MNQITEIKRVQKALKQNYSVEEYTKIVDELKTRSNSDPEILGFMADDTMSTPDVRLFALAAIGEL